MEDSVPTDGFAARIVEGPRPAPALKLRGLDGRVYNTSDFRGSVVLLHFWASWCVPCRTEMPALKKLELALRDKGFVLLAVAEDSRKNTEKFAEEFGLDFRVLVDQYGAGMRRFKIKAIPSSVVIGRDGTIKAYIIGARDYAGPGAFEFFDKLLEDGK
jgi:peroxiredoxin